MALYLMGEMEKERDTCTAYGQWLAEADFSSYALTNSADAVGRLLSFSQPTRYPKAPSVSRREEEVWEQKTTEAAVAGRQLFNGPLMSYRRLARDRGRFGITVAPSCYKEHHGSYPFRCDDGTVRLDEWTRQFFPYRCVLENGVALPSIPNSGRHFPSLAFSAVLEANGRFLYFVRSGATDCYRKVPSLPSGGRISGDPHKVVDDLVADAAAMFLHLAQMLSKETGLEPERIEEMQLTGLQRSLEDLDAQLSFYVCCASTPQEIEAKMRAGGMIGPDKKYAAVLSFPATPDGMRQLLRLPFPSTVLPVVVYAAPSFGVDPQDVLPGLKVLE